MHGLGEHHRSGRVARRQSARDAEADDPFGPARECALQQQREPRGIAAPSERDDAVAARDGRLGGQAGRRKHGERGGGGHAHMPTETVLALLAFRLRNRAIAHSGKNFG